LLPILVVALLAGLSPAVAQTAPPVPTVPAAPDIPPDVPHVPYLRTHYLPRFQSLTDRLGVYDCDNRDPAACLLPFPNDRFTVADPTTATGRRINFGLGATPWNILGKPVDPTELNRNDGFSPGSPILTVVPGVRLDVSQVAPITDIGQSLDADQPVVLLNTRTGARHPFWAELDHNATRGDRQTLIIRPAVNFDEGTRYVVALRNLKDAQSHVIQPNAIFKAERTGPASPQMERVFADLAAAGVARDNLFLAWDFTVASTRNITERMLKIRDDAFASLAGRPPAFKVSAVTASADNARHVTGSFTVPNYLNLPGGLPFSRFNYLGSTDGLPVRNGDLTAKFTCNIPAKALVTPARASLYGHGLLGGQGEVDAGNVKTMGAVHNVAFCATDWIGMATEDVPNVGTILVDGSNFPTLPDRVQQGMLNFLFLGRLLKDPRGFASDGAFRSATGPLIDTSAVFYDGNSQGGIIGGALLGVSQDITRGTLGVGAMNYSTLLNRSVDFDQYASVLYNFYPDQVDQQILFSLMQMLWDRAEADGYAAHVTHNPLPGTPVHQVLLLPAVGDHQVANVASEVMARTMGLSAHWPAVRFDRSADRVPLWGIPHIGTDPFDGSAIVYWDSFNTPIPPLGNEPPSQGSDPHGFPRSQAKNQLMKSWFLRTGGSVVDTCGGTICR
jgi:hypothetical protein